MSVMEIYRSVIDDVIKNVRQDFLSEASEETLLQLQNTWEGKVISAGSITGYSLDSSNNNSTTNTTSGLDLNAPFSNTPQTILPNFLFPSLPPLPPIQSFPTSTFTPQSTSLSDLLTQLQQSQSTTGHPFQLPPLTILNRTPHMELSGKPQPFMPPPNPSWTESPTVERQKKKPRKNIGQFDGGDDEKLSDEDDEQHDEDELDSSLDDDDEEPKTEHIILCQFEKIARIKNKRKCTLKDGIMRLNGRDYLFSKATGECEF